MGRDEDLNPRRQVASGMARTAAYDRFGRMIHSGDLVVMLNQGTIMWRVQETKPVMAPNAPPGMVEVSLVAVFVQGVPGGTPLSDLVLVRSSEGAQTQPVVQES